MNTQQNSPDVVINATNRVPQDIKASSLLTVAQLNNEETDPAAMSLEVSLVTSNELQQKQQAEKEQAEEEEVLNKMKNKTSVFDIPNVSSLSLKKKKRHKISKRSVTATSIQDKNLIINVQDVDIKQDEVNGIAAINSDNVSLIKTIKTSLSLTSLPPDEYQEECRDVIKAKLNLERPYNSLKKNADRNLTNQLAQRHARTYERLDGGVGVSTGTGTGVNCCYGDKDNNNYASNSKLQRCSWYSGHSSSSLHSSAATLGIGSGKDDLWAAIQTNYNYIMDTNLLDTCKEARCEIERATSVLDNQMDKCFKVSWGNGLDACCWFQNVFIALLTPSSAKQLLDDNQRNEGFCSDPKELRKWLREMEHKIHKAPTLTQATQLSCMELEKHLAEHSILYHEIVSHARVVSACIRAATNKELQHNSRCQQQQQQLIQQQQIQNPEQQTSLNSTDSSLIAEQTNSSLSLTDETISTATNSGNNNNNNKNNSNNNTTTITTTLSSSSGIGGTITFDLQKATSSDTASTTSTNTSTSVATPAQQHKKSDNNLDRLQNRYHLLYLKAFEVQLWLDGLLRKKTKSPGNTSIEDDLDSEENIDDLTDYECELNEDVYGHKEEKQQYIEAGATEDDFNDVISDLETDITNEQASESLCQDVKQYNHCQQQSLHLVDEDNNLQISTNNKILQHLQIQPQQQQQNCDCKHSKIDYEDGDDEEDEDDDVDDSVNKDVIDGIQWIYNGSRVLKGRSISKQNQPKSSITTTFTPTLTDFEADSESSDLETVKSHMRNYRKHHQVFAHNFIPMKRNNHQQGTNTKKTINCNMNSVWSAVKTLMVNELQQEEHLSQRDIVEVVTSETASTEAATSAKAMPCSGSTIVQNIAEIPVKVTVNESNYKQPQKRLEQQPDEKNIANMSPNNQHHIRGKHHTANKVSTMLRSQTQQQQKHKQKQKQQQRKKPIHPSTDISKFNRSNRKSKNCAIFYFRHLDTDNETNCSTTTTSTTNCVEEDIADHNNDDEANYEFDYEYDEVDDDDDDNDDDDDGGCDVIENCIHAAREHSEIYVEGDGVLSSSFCNSHTSDQLKSADASSDDGGWLYSRAPAHVQTKTKIKTITQVTATGGDCLNSNKTRLSIDDNICCNGSFSLPVNTAESSLTSSTSSSLGSNLGNSTQLSGDVVGIPEVVLTSSICDSDKNSLYIDGDISMHANYNNMTVFNDCSNSSSSSNDMLTEATTATSNSSTHTNVTQILNIDPIQRNGVELQLNNDSIVNNFQYNNNNNNNNNDNHYKLSSYNAMAQFVAVIDHHNDSNNNNNNNDNNNNSNNHDSNNNNNRNHCANSSRSIVSAVSGVATAANNLHTTLLTETNQRTLSTSSQSLPAMTTAVIAPLPLLNDVNGGDITNNANIIGKANARLPTGGHVVTGKLSSNPSNHQRHHHQHHLDYNVYSNQPCTNNNRQQHYQKIIHGQALLHVNVGKSLPPRSPAKVHTSNLLTNSNSYTTSPLSPGQVQQNHKVSHECIKQLVLEAEHLVRDEALKTPTKQQQQQQQLQHKHSNNTSNNNTLVQISTTIKKRENVMVGPIKQRVQEWLEHQPTSTPIQQQHQQQRNCHDLMVSVNNGNAGHTPNADDCEASGEASETDSIPQQCSDTSEGFTDSIATCLQTSTNSQGNSTERIGGSAEPIAVHSNQSLNMNMKVIKRQQTRRKSERPWSVSCLSQLTTTTTDSGGQMLRTKKITNSQVQAGLASHSISESALDSLSPRRPRDCTNATIQSHHHHSHHHNHHHHHQHQVKSYDSKNSLKRRKTRKKRLSYSGGKKSDTGSEDYCALNGSAKLSQNLLIQTAETMTNQQLKDITQALLSLQKAASCSTHHLSAQVTNGNNGTANQINALVGNASNANNNNINESEEEPTNLMQPNFRVGSFTTAYMTSEARLGSLAALATYMNDEGQQQGAYTTGPEDQHSSFSETAWDNYQEKYNSENYSEGFDSDAARRLMEFGDDYRNFIDSQSDCCSSLSAANNLESLSPPRMDSLPQQSNETKLITHDAIVSSVDHARRRRALELEYERRRKNLELRRKSCQESSDHHQTTKSAFVISPPTTSHLMVVTAKNTERLSYHHAKVGGDTLQRKLEFGMSHSSSQSLRRTSESDTSQRRRKPHDDRRRSSRNLDKCIKVIPATSSSSGDDSDNEKEIRNLLQQSRNRLEDTRALKIRCHLLRPEDYNEIVNTCRDNIRCLESVIRGPSSSVLTTYCINQSKDLLSAWEDLLAWSENAAAARKMQEEMMVLKYALNRLGNKSSFELLDTEPAIQIAIEALKNEKVQLQTYRTSMLKLNASVHSWLTRQEKRLESAVMEQKVKEAATVANSIVSGGNNSCTSSSSSNSDGSNMMCADGEKLIEMKEEIVQVQRQQQQQEQHDQQQQVNLLKLNNNDNNNLVENNNGQVTTSTTNTITIIDSNGNQIETHTVAGTNLSNAMSMKQTMSTSTTTTTTTTTIATSDEEKELDLNTLINSENEFHKHLKNEVSDMYTAWDEADARINSQLEILTSSLIAWRQLESGLCEFQLALGQDRGTLQGLEGALERGQASPGELVQNVKLVAKLLSEKINVSHEQLTAAHDYLDPNHILQIARFTASNGSLSDSGISDGGTTSDGGLSERERRLGMLRRLAKQLESALAPGSDAMKSIAARMESAEAELKSLQNTCRDLIVRTAASQQNKKLLLKEITEYADNEKSRQNSSVTVNKGNGHMINNQRNKQEQQRQEQQQNNSLEMVKNKRNRRLRRNVATQNITPSSDGVRNNAQTIISQAPDDYDDDPSDDPTAKYELDSSDDEQTGKPRRGWAWRIARVAVPMQLALFTVFCAACLMQPNCCDNINNFSMSFTPQLRYVRGPPPI